MRKISFDPAPLPEPQQGQASLSVQKLRPLLERAGAKRTGALGAISASLGNLSEQAKRADEIEQRLIEGQVIVELDPAVIDNSFVVDRMEATPEQNAAFRDVIGAHGQNVPILVRPKPAAQDRFEVAYGHRRLRAARELGIKVKAVVRPLTDEQLVVAQGQENSGRTDLTFIERARFAARLEERGFSREIIMASLNLDKAALSRLIAIATRIPALVIDAIGPAPGFGRIRWQELMELVETGEHRARAERTVRGPDFLQLETDKRFEHMLAALRQKANRAAPEHWNAGDGTRAARIARAGRKVTLTFDDRVTPAFGDFVKDRLQRLYEEYRAETSSA